MKVVLSDVASGFNLQAINNNFQTIAGELNNKVLYRANPIGEPDQMIGTNLDMNGNGILNMSLGNFINDAAAALGGVAIGQFYRNGNVVMVRVV